MKRKLVVITIFVIIFAVFFLFEFKTTIRDSYHIYDPQFNLKGSAEFNVEIKSIILKQYMEGEITINSKSFSLFLMRADLNKEGLYETPLRYYDAKEGGARHYGYMYYNRNHDIFVIIHDSDNFEIITNKDKVEIQNFIDKIIGL